MAHSVLLAQAQTPDQIFGTVQKPAGVAAFDAASGGGAEGIGLLVFISTLIKVGTIIAGIWVFFQFILAGYDYITSNGDTGSHNRVKDRLTMSIIGLVLIVTAYTATALISLLLFGDAGFILNPVIQGPPAALPTTPTGN